MATSMPHDSMCKGKRLTPRGILQLESSLPDLCMNLFGATQAARSVSSVALLLLVLRCMMST